MSDLLRREGEVRRVVLDVVNDTILLDAHMNRVSIPSAGDASEADGGVELVLGAVRAGRVKERRGVRAGGGWLEAGAWDDMAGRSRPHLWRSAIWVKSPAKSNCAYVCGSRESK